MAELWGGDPLPPPLRRGVALTLPAFGACSEMTAGTLVPECSASLSLLFLLDSSADALTPLSRKHDLRDSLLKVKLFLRGRAGRQVSHSGLPPVRCTAGVGSEQLQRTGAKLPRGLGKEE